MIKNGVIFRKSPFLNSSTCNYPGFGPLTTVLKKGTVVKKNHYPLPCDILFEKDVAIKVRDGVTLYADIFRPVKTDEPVPALLNSTCFGKAKKDIIDMGQVKHMGIPIEEADIWEVAGVKKEETSGLNAFEATDPGFFVKHGYAVVMLDERGCYMSEGDNNYFGTQLAEDDYDVIEWLACQEWCNGKVAMTGNSWLGINQWFAGAVCPPHLTCLAPWEGWYDMYRDEYMVGGIPNLPGFRFDNAYSDEGWMEDVVANCLAHPLLDDYWKGKIADVSKITVPVYAVSSWTSLVHCQGTIMAWRKLKTENKWIRVHNTQEWRDSYNIEHEKDLLKFFDYYLKDKKKNGWDKTPKCRLSILDPGGEDIVERVEDGFPLSRQNIKEIHLDAADMTINDQTSTRHCSVSYNGWDGTEIVKFRYQFKKDTEICGYINVKLYVESDGYNDMDLFVRINKIDEKGNKLYHRPVPGNDIFQGGGYSGPTSRQRVSLRKLNPEKATVTEPYKDFNVVEKLSPYEIVPVEIGMFPTGMIFHAGEYLELEIAGYPFFPLPGEVRGKSKMNIATDNNGNHIIHTGGEYDSKIILPTI